MDPPQLPKAVAAKLSPRAVGSSKKFPLESDPLLELLTPQQRLQTPNKQARKRDRTPSTSAVMDSTKRRMLSSPQSDTAGDSTLPLPSPSASPTHQASIQNLDSLLINNTSWEKYITQLDPSTLESREMLIRMLQRTDVSTLSNLHAILGRALKRDLITSLPIELTNDILSQLDFQSLMNSSLVNRNWALICQYGVDLWKSLIFKDKIITNDEEFDLEYQYIKSKRPLLDESSVFKLMYQRRIGIKKRWFDPKFKPKILSLDASQLGVITCLQFDTDKVVAGSDQSKIVVYDTETGTKRHELLGHSGGVWAMKYYQNTLASGSTDRTVRIWNIAQGKCTHIFHGHVSTVRCLEIIEPVQIGTDLEGNPIYYPPEPLLVTGSRDTTLNVWKLPMTNPDDDLPVEPIELNELNNPYLIKRLEGHSNSVRALSGHGDIIISGSYDSKAIVWDLKTFTKKFELIGHTDRIYSCVCDWKRNQCYTGSVDNTVRVWDLKTGKIKCILEGHQILVGLISASDNVLVSAAADSTVRIWDPNTGSSRFVLRGHASAITCVENDDERIVSGSQRSLKLWNAQTGQHVRDLGGDEMTGAVWQVKFDFRRCIRAVEHGDETAIEIIDFAPLEDDPWIGIGQQC